MTHHPLNEEEVLRMMDAEISVLVLVQGTLADNSAHYAYVSIPPSRYQAFKAAEAAGNYNLAEFGKILSHGAGKNPPPSVQKQMEKEYGANHCFEEELSRWVEESMRIARNNIA